MKHPLEFPVFITELIKCDQYFPFPENLSENPFNTILWQWSSIGQELLSKEMSFACSNFDLSCYISWAKEIFYQFQELATPSLALETRIQSLEKESIKCSDYIQDFCIHFLKNSIVRAEFFSEYSYLSTLLSKIYISWKKNIVDIHQYLIQDRDKLISYFDISSNDFKVSALKIGLSDAHNGHQSVYEMEFINGKSLFYKPRNLEIEKKFQDLLKELNLLGIQPDFKIIKILSLKNHGWVEKVNSLDCQSAKEVESFYIRSGVNLCLLYLLCGVDFHFENVIAAGEYPMLVDLECLLHPTPISRELDPVVEEFIGSVLSIGLLPNLIFCNVKGPGIDVGGLSNVSDQINPFSSASWEKDSNGLPKLVYYHKDISENNHMPFLNGARVNPTDYLNEILEGFETSYLFFSKIFVVFVAL